jgi:biotin-(acetyl-CoA carboxylase) ligase
MSTILSTAETTATWALQRRLALVSDASTGSTNDDAKKNAMIEDSELVLYLAAHQSAGRGRGANHWLDTGAGESLLSTWSFRMPSPPQAITGPRVGLALFTAARKTWPGLSFSLKAPNDLFLNGLKVAGLLIESVSSGGEHRILIGLGLNVLNHPRRFSEATHLAAHLEAPPQESEWFQFLDELRLQFKSALTEVTKPELNESARLELARALNANPKRPFEVKEVSAHGDLIFAAGKINWSDL